MLGDNIQIIKTKDNSIGLYDKNLDEIFHSIYGAKTEAFEKFIQPAKIINNKPLKILDICYGIGYNTKCALENFKNISLIDCVEINKNLVFNSYKFKYRNDIDEIIKSNLEKNDLIHFYIDDVRNIIKNLNKKYDIIFHDGFAPHKQSELWSEELIFYISKLLDKNGIYCTYNHSKPVLKALLNAGLIIGKTIKDNKIIGTCASFNKENILNPLNNYEIGQLNTKSAITYKDKNLNLSHQEIIENREKELKNSNLMTLSHYKKIKLNQD